MFLERGRTTHMAYDQITVGLLSLGSGAVLAAQEIPGLEMADRAGMAGLAAVLVWWMLTGFNKRLDKLTDAIDRLSGHEKKKKE